MIKSLSALAALAAAAWPGAASAQDFDHYLLALSWSPSWCAAEGSAEGAEQCAPGRGLGFTLHGLWPQYESGDWPEYCDTASAPSRRQTAAMADIMGSGGLAWYQWQKHGSCSGLDAAAYFDASRLAYTLLELPEPAAPVTAAELAARISASNPGLAPEDMIVTCRGDRLREVRICLDRDLAPRPCSAGVRADACRSRAPLDVPDAP